MKILFLSRWFPFPIDNGSKLRIYNLLRGLSSEHEVHLLSFADAPQTAKLNAMKKFCQTVQVLQWKEFQPTSLRALSGLFSMEPRSLVDTYSTQMETAIRQVLSRERIDLVISSQWQMAAYRHSFGDLPVLYEEVEIGLPYGQYKNSDPGLAHFRAGLTWYKQRQFLKTVLSKGQFCTVVSEKEKKLLASIVPGSQITVIPNGVSIEDYAGIHETPEVNTLIFTGSFRYNPNYEAMVWFIEQVLPLIQDQIPEVQLTITGDSAGLSLPKRTGVFQTGFVDDVRPLIARSWISIVPLLVGGGTRLKILEAMALGTPVISTSKGAEGLQVKPDEHLLIADTAELFAKKILTLLPDEKLRRKLVSSGYELVNECYDWRVILPKLLTLVREIGSSSTRSVSEVDYPLFDKG